MCGMFGPVVAFHYPIDMIIIDKNTQYQPRTKIVQGALVAARSLTAASKYSYLLPLFFVPVSEL